MVRAGRHAVIRFAKLPLILAAFIATLVLAACGQSAKAPWNNTDLTGVMPDLAFSMNRVDDAKAVTEADYKGKITMLYFGYTFCPDVCPTTLVNVAQILDKLGDKRADVRVLFVTVDPNRDTPEALKQYVDAFAPEVDGLRGTPDQLTSLARRYRVSYSATPAKGDTPYTVTHSSAFYVFDKKGAVRLLVSSLGTAKPDVEGTLADLKRLINE